MRRSMLWSMTAMLVLSVPAQAVTVTTSYFETEVPWACTASSVTNKGTYVRQYQGPYGECSGLTTYHIVHGGNAHPWSTESFYTYNGYLWQMMELFSSETTGSISSYRAFRNQNNFWKGIPVMPITYNNSSFFWSYPNYLEEYWSDSTGQPVCFNTQQTEVQGTVNWGYVYNAGTYSGWLQDKRAASLNKNTWHDVDVIVRVDQWGENYYEYYHYARWLNPATGSWQGLGIIEWQQWNGSNLLNSFENHYLVDCDVAIECTTSPP